MKSLKRTLCLVLALVMVLGLFGIASATSFTDDNQVQYKEAVEVVTGIGAINGMGDGTFNPKGTITRAQAATMVTRVALTAGVAADLTGVESSFTDVTVEGGFAWAIPSIEYMVKEGIINGMGDGTFNPNGEINGYAVLKMLLCVLGYGKRDEYVGNQWTLQVAVDASKKSNNLLAGRVAGSPLLSQPATREEVALYCYNALGATMVDYSKLNDVYSETTVTAAGDYGTKSLGGIVYGLKQVVTGVVTKNGATIATYGKAGKTEIGGNDYVINTGLDLIGHYVKVYYTTDANSNKNAYAVVDVSKVVEVAKDFSNKPADYKAAFGAEDVAFMSGAVGFNADSTPAANTNGAGLTAGKTAKAGTYILMTDSTDGKTKIASYLAPVNYTVAPVTAYTAPTATEAGSITLGTNPIPLPKTGDPTTVKVYDAPAVKDIAIMQATGDFTTISKATVVGSGVVSSVDETKGTLVAGGVTYAKTAVTTDGTISAFLAGTGRPGNLANGWTGAALVNNTCAFYADASGKIVAVGIVDQASDAGIVYVVDAYSEAIPGYGSTNKLVYVQCVNMNGEEVNYVVGLVDGSDAVQNSIGIKEGASGGATDFVGKLVTVKTTYNDTIKKDLATLAEVSNSDTTVYGSKTASGADYAATEKVINTNHYYSADTKFIFVDGTGAAMKVTTLTGPQIIPQNGVAKYSATKVDATNATVNYVVVNKAPKVVTTSGIMFVPKDFDQETTVVTVTGADGKPGTAYQNTAFVDGKPVSVLTTNRQTAGSSPADIDAGFYTFTVDAQGIYALTTLAATGAWDTGVVTNVYGNLLTTTGGTADLTNDNAEGAFIVDVPYMAAVAAGTTLPKQHTTLASLDDGTIYFTYKVEGTVTTVTGIYYMAATTRAATTTTATVAAADGNDAANKGVFSVTVAPTPAAKGTEVTITVTPTTAVTAAGGDVVLTVKSTDANINTTLTFNAASERTPQFVKFTMPAAEVDDIAVARQ